MKANAWELPSLRLVTLGCSLCLLIACSSSSTEGNDGTSVAGGGATAAAGAGGNGGSNASQGGLTGAGTSSAVGASTATSGGAGSEAPGGSGNGGTSVGAGGSNTSQGGLTGAGTSSAIGGSSAGTGGVPPGAVGGSGNGGTSVGAGGSAGAITLLPIVKVDFDMSGRPEDEVSEPGYTPWPVETASVTSMTLENVEFELSSVGAGTEVTSDWYKAGVQAPYYARLVDDGLTVEGGEAGAQIQMVLRGLPTGSHSLLVYHNNTPNPDNNTFAPVDVLVDGELVVTGLLPSVRAQSNSAAETSYFQFEAESGSDVVVSFRADTSTGASNANVMINGFELNTPNSAYQATNPSPADRDEHVDADSGSLSLSWNGADHAVSHDVYFGTDLAALSTADHSSPLFMGNQTTTSFSVNELYSMNTYYWRVDELDAQGEVTPGNIWYFRPRQLAFPDAEGYGRFARGGRGGVVVHVTNLNDSGEGSLRQAIEQDIGPRTIVFDVGGIIVLGSRLTLNSDHVTVAGQTAPGKGICIRSAPFGLSGATDVIVQDVRVRVGAGTTYDGMGMAGSEHSIIDHCSISWTIDEGFSSRSAKNITLQRTLISEALNIAGHANYPAGTAHGYAASISGDIGSFHHNLLAHCYGRNFSLAGGLDGNGLFAGRLDIFNNVVYNWGTRSTDGGAHQVNFVGNYYKPGPATSIFVALNAQYEEYPGTQQYYFAGNVMPGHFDESNQSAGRTYSGTPDGYEPWVSTAFFPSYATVESAEDAYKRVLSDVGCTQPVFDAHDTRIVTETLNGTTTYSGSVSGLAGLPDNESDVGGFEDYPIVAREASWDSDGDGLPDWWEAATGTNAASPQGDLSDANADVDHDGFTNLDDYLQWMAAPHYFVSLGTSVPVALDGLFSGYRGNPSYSAPDAVGGTVDIAGQTATFSPSACGLDSFSVSVNDGGSTMTRKIGVYVDGCTTAAKVR